MMAIMLTSAHIYFISNIALSPSGIYKTRRVLLLGPTGISAENKGGTTIHPGIKIKPGTMKIYSYF